MREYVDINKFGKLVTRLREATEFEILTIPAVALRKLLETRWGCLKGTKIIAVNWHLENHRGKIIEICYKKRKNRVDR